MENKKESVFSFYTMKYFEITNNLNKTRMTKVHLRNQIPLTYSSYFILSKKNSFRGGERIWFERQTGQIIVLDAWGI